MADDAVLRDFDTIGVSTSLSTLPPNIAARGNAVQTMPICEADPWRFQYFENVPCPDDVLISTEDPDSWMWYPAHRWIYDKMEVALSQGLQAAPRTEVMPPSFPVFSKPITNLRGMGVGSQVIASESEYKTVLTAGHFWCTLLTGAHVSSDVALVDGEPRWWRHTAGVTTEGGTFDYWHIHAAPMPEIETWCGDWNTAKTLLRGYTGMANFETIGGRIIEAHLRFADQWPDLYGPRWVEAVGSSCTQTQQWTYPDSARVDGFSVVLFLPHRSPLPPSAGQKSSTWCAAWMVFPACRSRSTKTRTRHITPCLQAGSGSRSSMPRPWPRAVRVGRRYAAPSSRHRERQASTRSQRSVSREAATQT